MMGRAIQLFGYMWLIGMLAAAPALAARPNVVVLLADDMGSADLGCYGGPVHTPVLDSLAGQGVRFPIYYAACAVCSPTRASLLTGRQHIRTGVWSWIAEPDPPRQRTRKENRSHLLQREVTLAEVLREAGYETMHSGKWHLGLLSPTPGAGIAKPTPTDHGFDEWFATALNAHPSHRNPENFYRNGQAVGRLEGYSCQLVVDEAIRWLDARQSPQKPFFLNVWFHEPHAPLAAPPKRRAKYGPESERSAVYSGTIDNLDSAVGRLVRHVHSVAPPENTLIVFLSDNGSYLRGRNGSLRGMKGTNWEGGLRVPGIYYWPGTIAAGEAGEEFGSVLDVLPTICEFADVEKPEGVHWDGTSLAPFLTGESPTIQRQQPLYWHLQKSRPIVALRAGSYVLVADPDFPLSTDNLFDEEDIPKLQTGTYRNYRLFDLASDPSQQHDLSAEQPKRVELMKRQLLEINASVMAEGTDWSATGP